MVLDYIQLQKENLARLSPSVVSNKPYIPPAQPTSLKSEISKYVESKKSEGYIENPDGTLSKKSGDTTTTINISSSGIVNTTITTNKPAITTKQPRGEYEQIENEIRKLERAIKHNPTEKAKETIYFRLKQLYEARDNLANTGQAFYTVVTPPETKTESISTTDIYSNTYIDKSGQFVSIAPELAEARGYKKPLAVSNSEGVFFIAPENPLSRVEVSQFSETNKSTLPLFYAPKTPALPSETMVVTQPLDSPVSFKNPTPTTRNTISARSSTDFARYKDRISTLEKFEYSFLTAPTSKMNEGIALVYGAGAGLLVGGVKRSTEYLQNPEKIPELIGVGLLVGATGTLGGLFVGGLVASDVAFNSKSVSEASQKIGGYTIDYGIYKGVEYGARLPKGNAEGLRYGTAEATPTLLTPVERKALFIDTTQKPTPVTKGGWAFDIKPYDVEGQTSLRTGEITTTRGTPGKPYGYRLTQPQYNEFTIQGTQNRLADYMNKPSTTFEELGLKSRGQPFELKSETPGQKTLTGKSSVDGFKEPDSFISIKDIKESTQQEIKIIDILEVSEKGAKVSTGIKLKPKLKKVDEDFSGDYSETTKDFSGDFSGGNDIFSAQKTSSGNLILIEESTPRVLKDTKLVTEESNIVRVKIPEEKVTLGSDITSQTTGSPLRYVTPVLIPITIGKTEIKNTITPIQQQPTRIETGIKTGLRQQQTPISETRTGQQQRQGTNQLFEPVTVTQTTTQQETITQQITTPRTQQRTYTQETRPFSESNTSQNTKRKPPIIPKFTDLKPTKLTGAFSVLIKKRGKFTTVEKNIGSYKKAFDIGSRIVDTTASASFKIVGDSTENILNERYYKRGDIIIEKRKFRISNPSERFDIRRGFGIKNKLKL